MVILEIFPPAMRSCAARAQVEIARLGYMAPACVEMHSWPAREGVARRWGVVFG